MKVSIINIGDELLIGQVTNTNATTMARLVTAAGMEVGETVVVGDEPGDIRSALQRCMEASSAVLITGGLGPTKDDMSKKVLCDFFGATLVENAEALANVQRLLEQRGMPLTPINRQQALVPDCCTVINNAVGTAPCMWFEHVSGCVVVALPGVPFEMEHLMRTAIVPRLANHFIHGHILNKNILIHGIGESFLSDLIEPWELALPHSIRLAYLPQAGMVKLRLTARGNDPNLLQQQIDHAVSALYPLAGQYIMGEDCEDLPQLAHQLLTTKGLTLATAESCTGGTIASSLTALSGASAYLRGAIVAYSNQAKQDLLGVQPDTLSTHGAVSQATVREMAEGARRQLHADFAIATSGIAGPSGGTPDKPVGTVCIALSTPSDTQTRTCPFAGDRLRVVQRALNEALAMLITAIKTQS